MDTDSLEIIYFAYPIWLQQDVPPVSVGAEFWRRDRRVLGRGREGDAGLWALLWLTQTPSIVLHRL